MKHMEWLLCPICHNKTRIKIREDTELKKFPLYCPKCKQEILIRACSATLANNKAEIRDKAERERPSATWKGSRAAGQRQSHRQRFHVGVP